MTESFRGFWLIANPGCFPFSILKCSFKHLGCSVPCSLPWACPDTSGNAKSLLYLETESGITDGFCGHAITEQKHVGFFQIASIALQPAIYWLDNILDSKSLWLEFCFPDLIATALHTLRCGTFLSTMEQCGTMTVWLHVIVTGLINKLAGL